MYSKFVTNNLVQYKAGYSFYIFVIILITINIIFVMHESYLQCKQNKHVKNKKIALEKQR